MQKRKRTMKATKLIYTAMRHLNKASRTIGALEHELDGRPASLAIGATDIFDGIPTDIRDARTKISRFYQQNVD